MTIAWDRAILAAAILVACYLVAWAVRKLGADTAFRLGFALFVLIAAAVFVAPRSSSQQDVIDIPVSIASAMPSTVASFGGMTASRTRAETMTGAPRPRTATPSPSANPSYPKRGTGPAATAGPRSTSASSAPVRTGATPKPLRHALSGSATFYCTRTSPCTRGYPGGGCRPPQWACYAAAGPELRRLMGSWRGRSVVVSYRGASVRVRLIDCLCSAGLIDLYGDVFSQLAPLSAGRISVRVTWA